MRSVILLLLLCLLGTAPQLLQAEHSPTEPEGVPIGNFLTPEGRLDLPADFSGSLNLAGYEVRMDEVHGIQALPASPLQIQNSPITGLTTDGSEVLALVIDGSGNLYAGGRFKAAGGIAVSNIAKWDGSSWSALGLGLNDPCYALAIAANGDLYAGGEFLTAGGVSADRIAKWDGSNWSALGLGLDGTTCNALTFDSNGDLYAGGDFFTAGGQPADHIARWDGFNWFEVGSGLAGPCYALALDSNDTLYVGGEFLTAGGVSANNIAKWDGSNWLALGSGLDDDCNALAFDSNGDLYAGGRFTTAGGGSANRIAKWDGSNWSALGDGLSSTCRALAFDSNGDLYAGGDFTTLIGVGSALRVAKWDGSNWSALGSGMDDDCNALAIDSNDDLYVGGQFNTAGGGSASNIAQWDGSSWSGMGGGTSNIGICQALVVDSNGNLYAGGQFSTAGGVSARNIAKWDGSNWSALGSGLSATCFALAIDTTNGHLYVGGNFTDVDGIPGADRIAKWDGSAWSALGSGLTGTCLALAIDGNGDLYAGGSFFSAGGVSSTLRIAKWDGSNWSPLGSGLTNTCRALAIDGNGVLYAGGAFNYNGINRIAQWDGSTWSAVGLPGLGLNGTCQALAIDSNGNLYAGGSFTEADGNFVFQIAKWDGSFWSALGTGLDGECKALAIDSSDNLYVGGSFTTAGGVSASGIAKWDGTWSALGSGVNGNSNALVIDTINTGDLYVGGSFTEAFDEGGLGIAQYSPPNPDLEFVVGEETSGPNNTVTVPISVNSFTSITNFQGTITYDPAILTFQSSNSPNATVATTIGAPNGGSIPAGKATFGWADFSGTGQTLTDGTVIAELTFLVASTALEGQSDITIDGSLTTLGYATDPNATTFETPLLDQGFVYVDATAPSLATTDLYSNNANSDFAKVGDVVTLDFTTDVDLGATPSVTFTTGNGAQATTVTGSGTSWTATYTVQSGDDGVVAYVITMEDIYANSTTTASATTDDDGDDVTIDTIDPVISCPFTGLEEFDNTAGQCDGVVSWSAATATDDNLVGSPTLSSGPSSGATLAVGVQQTVVYTVSDEAGNTSTCSFDVVVRDTEDPVLTVPASTSSYNNGAGDCDASVDLDALTSATDNCPTSPAITYTLGGSPITSPHTFAVGTHTVTATATDGASNTDVETFVIEVLDNEDPILTVPGTTTTVNNDAGVCEASVDLNALTSATDNCTGSPAITYTLSGSPITSPHTFAVGTHTVIATATDGASNTHVQSFDIEVVDNEDPVLTVPGATSTFNNDAGVCQASVDLDALTSATDNCTGSPAITYTLGGSPITSPHTFAVGTHTLTSTATDGATNTDVETFVVEVVDNEDPVFPGTINPITVQLGTDGTVSVTGADFNDVLTNSTDNCGLASLTVGALDEAVFDCNSLNSQSVSLILTDIYGNDATTTATVNVENNPVVGISGAAVTLNGDPINGTSFDLAGDQGVQTQQAGGVNTFTFTLAPCSNNDIGAAFASPSTNDLDVTDAIAIIQHTLLIQDLGSPYKRIAADVNNTDNINVIDAFQVARRILTLIPDFEDPNGGGSATVAFVPSGYVFTDANNPWSFDTRLSYTDPAPATAQNFTGIKLGDANGDWLGAARTTAPVDTAYLVMEDLVAQPGQLITIPVRVKDFADMSGYQFTLNWDEHVLELEEVRDGVLQAMYNTETNGKLASVWFDLAGSSITLPDEEVVFELVFRASGAWGTETELSLSSDISPQKAYNDQQEPISILAEPVHIAIGKATSVDPLLQGYAFTKAMPNPFDQTTKLVFSLGQPELVEIDILNALGQTIHSFRSNYGAGEHELQWDGRSRQGTEVSTGVYYVRMRAGAFSKSIQVQKMN